MKGDAFSFLKRPSIGAWAGLLRSLCKLKLGSSELRWAPQIAEWYNQSRNAQNLVPLSLMAEVEEVAFERKAKLPNAELLNALVTYRNKLGHGANLPDDMLVERLALLESILALLLASMPFLPDMKIIYVDRVEATTRDSWLHHMYSLPGRCLRSSPRSRVATWCCPLGGPTARRRSSICVASQRRTKHRRC